MEVPKQKTMDGNTAAAYISYAFTDTAMIYPITPSSTMAEEVDRWSAQGKRNLFGQPVLVREMQSEGGAAGAMHGSLQAGALTTTYTASQGLLLMIPNLYKMAGELLPGVLHVSARSLASNALSIFGDHQDVMSVRQVGAALLASASVQECMELGAVAHLSAISSRVPAIHFFDGFRTSHEVQKIDVLDYEDLRGLLDTEAVDRFRRHALNPEHPVLRGTTQNPDIFFQTREAINPFYTNLPELYQHYMDKVAALTGRSYHLFDYYGVPDAETVLVAMGSSCEVIRETVEERNRQGGQYGLIQVRLYRPFSGRHLRAVLPPSTRRVAVLDRTKEPGAEGEPLYLDVRNALYESETAPLVIGGRYGLGSKDFTPRDVMAVLANLERENPLNGFTVGITDDVTGLSLPVWEGKINSTPPETTSCQFWGMGADGTVGANKTAIKLIGDHTPLYAQGYFSYDSKKSGGLTVSHLRFGAHPIRAPYLVTDADFVACHCQSYVGRYDLAANLKQGGTFLLNCSWTEGELEHALPPSLRRALAQKKARLFLLNASKIANELGLSGRINMIMQAAFFRLTGVLPATEAAARLKQSVEENYGRQGSQVVEKNRAAIDAGMTALTEIAVRTQWLDACEEKRPVAETTDFVRTIMEPMLRQEGDKLPVSAFRGAEDGTYPTGTTKYEKRAIADRVPVWNAEKCLQCNQCAFVCPHGVLRPRLLTPEQCKSVPPNLPKVLAKGAPKRFYHLSVSPLDCTGCGSCTKICPAGEKALGMEPLEDCRQSLETQWNAVDAIPYELAQEPWEETVKSSQFRRPLLEFSGACAGCGETPYAKLITQLFGERMMISNSAGCATVWGGSAPTVPYAVNERGHGPAWGFSLFEDNAEYGFGMLLGCQAVRRTLAARAEELLASNPDGALGAALRDWLKGIDVSEGTRKRADSLTAALDTVRAAQPLAEELFCRKDYFIKRSNWIFGGDGWAYDIGYGGLDHVLASGEDINVMVFDTEVYSNTGGQASKSTPAAAVAKFASAGKQTKKKDLGLMAMSYGYVYVAQIAMGADKAQTLRAIQEAEAYPGPSLIIGYAPCVNHGIRGGMGESQLQQKRAVEAGYWSLYRYHPDRQEGALRLDSGEPTASFRDFLHSEVRFSSLEKKDPERAAELFAKAERDASERREVYRHMAKRGE